MARTTVEEVNEILEEDGNSTKLAAMLIAANALVTDVVGSDTTITDTLKEEIERWLTAHLYVTTVKRGTMAAMEKIGGGPAPSIEFANLGRGLKSTTYGNTVLELDTTGKFAALGNKKARVTAFTSFTYD